MSNQKLENAIREAFQADMNRGQAVQAMRHEILDTINSAKLHTKQGRDEIFYIVQYVKATAKYMINNGLALDSNGDTVKEIKDYSLFNTTMKNYVRKPIKLKGYNLSTTSNGAIKLEKIVEMTPSDPEPLNPPKVPEPEQVEAPIEVIKNESDIHNFVQAKLGKLQESVINIASHAGFSEQATLELLAIELASYTDSLRVAVRSHNAEESEKVA